MQEILSDKEHMDAMSWIFSDERMPHLKDPYEGFSRAFRVYKGLEESPYKDWDHLTQEDLDRYHLRDWMDAHRHRMLKGMTPEEVKEYHEMRAGGWKDVELDYEIPNEPLEIRRIEDKVMDGFIQQDNKYNMGE